MKRGRPNTRILIQKSILETLEAFPTPLTVSGLAKSISGRLNKTVSWNTVQKYLNELVEIEKVVGLATPHSKIEGKQGLTVYQLKK